MKVFHCDHCGHLLFFENIACVSCGHRLAYLPDLALVGSLDEAGGDLWTSPLTSAAGQRYRLVAELSPLQQTLLRLLGVPEHAYARVAASSG